MIDVDILVLILLLSPTQHHDFEYIQGVAAFL